MTMMSGTRLLKLLTAAGILAAVCNCAEDNNGALVISQMQTLDPESCQVEPDEKIFRGAGILDMAVARSYTVFPLIRNNILDIVKSKGFQARDFRLNTKDVSLRRAVLSFSPFEETEVAFPTVDLPLSGTVNTESHAIVGIEAISSGLINELRNSRQFITVGSQGDVRPARDSITVSLKLVVHGQTNDGNEVESNPFFFKLEICNGCLVFYPPSASGPEGPAPNCSNSEEEILPEQLCAVGQDRPLHCLVCSAFAPDPLARQLCQPPL